MIAPAAHEAQQPQQPQRACQQRQRGGNRHVSGGDRDVVDRGIAEPRILPEQAADASSRQGYRSGGLAVPGAGLEEAVNQNRARVEG
ncbi:MAG: hypothetical protein ACJAVR_001556 [Paracoccaceae bacterium]|jgi:hypothetical protein